MHVDIRLFAQLRDKAGVAELSLELADGATARAAWTALVDAHPDLAPFASSVSCAVNAAYVPMHTTVHAGDEVAFLPPVSGG